MLAFNFVIASASFWLSLLINHKFLQPALRNRKRFRLYELRDELSLLAMEGKLEEGSEEYQVLMDVINSAITATDSFKVTDYLRFLWKFHKDKELNQKIENIIERIRSVPDREYCDIASRAFQVMHEILHSDTRTVRFFFFPLFVAVAEVLSVLMVLTPKKTVQEKKEALREMDEELGGYSRQFGELCAAT